MTVILHRKPFTSDEVEIVIEAVTTGRCPDYLPELQEIADEIAMAMPQLLEKARLPDTSDNRKKLIEVVMLRWAMPKTARPSHSYRRFR